VFHAASKDSSRRKGLKYHEAAQRKTHKYRWQLLCHGMANG
jgi:hypothetical protein